jgi:flagellar L-ring protein precursor FlgH
MTLKRIFLLMNSIALLTGCSSFGAGARKWLMGGSDPVAQAARSPASKSFNSQSNLPPETERNYRRMTKDNFSQGSQLEETAGSLWVMEGQGAYLFSQNIIRMIGDPLKVGIEGEAKAQLSSKVSTIKSLLDKLEARRSAINNRGLASQNGEQPNQIAAQSAAPAPGANANGAQANAQGGNGASNSESELGVKSVPTRIIERLADGSYRVRGQQPLMIGSREYKVIVTGLIRAEDFSDEGVTSEQLLDPTFDVVAERKRESL